MNQILLNVKKCSLFIYRLLLTRFEEYFKNSYLIFDKEQSFFIILAAIIAIVLIKTLKTNTISNKVCILKGLKQTNPK